MGLSDQLQRFTGVAYTGYDPTTGEGLDRPPPTAAELRDGETAPPLPATYDQGVVYFADHETLDDGIARQARRHARALYDAGVAVRLQTISNRVRRNGQWFFPAGEDLLAPEVVEEVAELRRATVAHAVLMVRHIVLTDASSLRHLLFPSYLKEYPDSYERVLRHTVVYVPFESDKLAPELAELLGRAGQVWLQCQRNIEAFENAGISPRTIRLVPNAYDEHSLVAGIAERRPIPPSGRRYYNIGKWEPRKGHAELIGAFLSAHGPKDPATLLLKTSGFGEWADYPRDAGEAIRWWLPTTLVRHNGWTAENVGSRLRVETGVMTEAEIAKLHEVSNIYVSASHGEGWDYPAFDACLAGNALVHVGFGGSEDYAPPDASWVTYKLGTVHPGYLEKFGWHADARWAVYELADLIGAMKSVVVPADRRARAPLSQYGTLATGVRMRQYLAELATELELDLPVRP